MISRYRNSNDFTPPVLDLTASSIHILLPKGVGLWMVEGPLDEALYVATVSYKASEHRGGIVIHHLLCQALVLQLEIIDIALVVTYYGYKTIA
jgi:hypothetical protein